MILVGCHGGSASGLYAHTRDSTTGTSTLRKLVTLADSIGGQPITFLGAGAASTDASHAAFYAVTNTNGIYTVPIPAADAPAAE